MTIKKIKSVEQQLLEKELMHSGKYGHKSYTSKKAYKRTKIKRELKEQLDDYDDEHPSNL